MKAFITGAGGFVGSNVATYLLDRGSSVTVLYRTKTETIDRLVSLGARAIQGDISRRDDIHTAMEGHDVVVHAAAKVTDWGSTAEFKEINIEGTRNMCIAGHAHQVSRFIFISTSDIFGFNVSPEITEESPLHSWDEPYPDTKLEATRIVQDYAARGLKTVIFCPCWIYGPGDKTVIPLLADMINKGEMLY